MGVAFVDSRMAPAGPYYQQFPREPINSNFSVQVRSVVMLPGMTLASLCAAIQRECQQGDQALIVTHSSDRGVAIPLYSGTRIGWNTDTIGRLNGVLSEWDRAQGRQQALGDLVSGLRATRGATGRGFPRDDAGAAQFLTDELFGRLIAVRQLRLSAVHFRGCNLGASEDTLRTFRVFLGCGMVTGLNLQSAYASVSPRQIRGRTPQQRARTFDALLRRASFAQNADGDPGDRFGFSVQVNQRRHSIRFRNVAAESATATAGWIQRNLLPPGRPYLRGSFSIHALLELGSPVFPGDSGQINAGYAEHIVGSKRGDDIFP